MDRSSTLTIHVCVDLGEPTLAFLRGQAHNPQFELLTEAIMRLRKIETHLNKQDDQVAKFKTDTDAQFEAQDASLANVSADTTKLLAEIEQLKANATGELSAANQAILDGIVTRAAGISTRLKAAADVVPDEPVPLP